MSNIPTNATSITESCDDTLSVAYTTCSDCSRSDSDFECNNGDFRSKFIENIEPFKSNIENVSVENSSNVTFGNKTYFNGHVVITNFVVDGCKADDRNNGKNNLTNSTKEQYNGRSVLCFRSRWSLLIAFIVGCVAVIVTLLAAGYYLYILDITPDVSPIDDYEFIDRNKYGAQRPKKEAEPLALPIKLVIISHTVTPNCTDYLHCASRVRQIQDHHMSINGWNDIGLNFLVGGDGLAYEGCGYTVGAHTKNYNKVSICIAFIGDFRTYEAPEKQLRAAQRLIDVGINTKLINPDYVIYGQRQLRNLDSPGLLLYNQIMLWPHWSNDDIIPL